MAKINFPSLFQSPLGKSNFFFVFGNDSFLIERAVSFLHKKLGGNLETKTEADVLNGLASQPSLFQAPGSRSLTFIPHVTEKILSQLPTLPEGIFIFTSEKTRAHSKLVTYFTGNPHSLCIAAYSCPVTTFELDFMTEDLSLPLTFKNQLLKTYQHHRGGLLNALEKIKLAKDISEDHYTFFLENDLPEGDLATLRNAFLLKDKAQLIPSLALLGQGDSVPLLRLLMRSFLTLLELSSARSIAWNSLTFPVFFKDQPIFDQARSRWHQHDIIVFLQDLLAIENKAKTAAFSSSLVQQTLIDKLFHVKHS